jgi:transposase
MDNLSSHKGAGFREAIEATGARLLYLSPYSPDFNPIENAVAQLKAMLRMAAARTVESFWNTLNPLINAFSPSEWPTYFAELDMTQRDRKLL